MAYKEEHQSFMTGHNGTTYQEVAMVASISCIGCLARDLWLLSAAASKLLRPRILVEFILIVLPNIIGVTVLNNHIERIHCVFLSSTLSVGFYYLFQERQIGVSKTLHEVNLDSRKAFITYFRSMVNLSTAIAILAVDFPVFPRRLAKSEVYGFGGMDIGIGFFVVANAIVSNEARGKYECLPFLHQMKKVLTSTMPLFILGLARFITVKGADYHEHVSEYGVHWNFFFTLAALKISSTLVFFIIPTSMSAIGAVVATALHQILLSKGLSSHIVNGLDGVGGRVGLLDANREGIYSLPGYIAIYMLGVQLGSFLFKPRHNLREWLDVVKHLIMIFIACTSLMAILHTSVEPVSRRFANAAFVAWVLSQSCLMILECLLADIFISFIKAVQQQSGKQTSEKDSASACNTSKMTLRFRGDTQLSSSIEGTEGSGDLGNTKQGSDKKDGGKNYISEVCLVDAVGYNSLLFFLLANVMTGVVNMSIATIHASDVTAVVIMLLYMFILCFVVVSLRRRNISTKIW